MRVFQVLLLIAIVTLSVYLVLANLLASHTKNIVLLA